MRLTTLSLFPLVFALGCGGAFELVPDEDGFIELPASAEGRLQGTLFGETFDDDARVRVGRGFGTTVLELAMTTERAAVMHRIEIENETFASLDPGSQLVYVEGGPHSPLDPLACLGETVDAWVFDFVIDDVEFDVEEAGPDAERFEWQIASRHPETGALEVSTASLLWSRTLDIERASR